MEAAAFEFLQGFVHRELGIVLEAEKTYLVESRLGPLAQRAGADSVEALIHRLRREPRGPLHQDALEAMTTNETSFFRDAHPFAALRELVLPELIERRKEERKLSFWSAASSTGQEAYSLAMLVANDFPALADWNVQIIGTDISREVLDRARKGEYNSLEVNRGLPSNLLVRHFEQRGRDWVVRPEISRLVDFRRLNLVESWGSLPQMDVIFLRNVLIYFDVDLKRKILERVESQLKRGGRLFLGGAETVLTLSDAFERQTHGKATFYRRNGD